MLSYRHGYHAGNHADVLKHWVQVLCLEYLAQKDKPFLYIDTHAGAGLYALFEGFAVKTGEAKTGVSRLWLHKNVPAVFKSYIKVVQVFNEKSLKYYPGSAMIAAHLLREDDRLRLVEMHSADIAPLKQHLGRDRRVKIVDGDGFEQLKASLPPATRRGLILVDPPYEMKEDYWQVIKSVQDGLMRFATGTYLIWYPLLSIAESARIEQKLKKLPCASWLNVQLAVSAKPQGPGMYGSGMFVVNPPWVLKEQLQGGLPWLTKLLARDDAAHYTLDTSPAPHAGKQNIQ